MKRIDSLNKVPLLTWVLFAASCSADTSPIEPNLADPGKPAFSTLGNGEPPIQTTFSATLVRVEPVGQRVLPSGTVISEFGTFWETRGDWEGIFIGDNSQTFHRNGVVTGQAFFTFEGTVLGLEGTLEYRFQATTQADGTFTGRATILRGTGELANLRGHGTNVIVAPGEIEGVVIVHFAP